jgi:hypothetical protein
MNKETIKNTLIITLVVVVIALTSGLNQQEREIKHIINKTTMTKQKLTEQEITAVLNSNLADDYKNYIFEIDQRK